MPFLAGYVTPQDYGALGNGTNDDTSAIQAAINAIATAGGGDLFFPQGTYKLTAALSLTSANVVSFLGVGPGVSVLNQTSTTANAITYNPSGNLNYAAIANISVTGPGSGSGIGVLLQANSGANTVSSCNLENVSISGFGSHNVQITTGVACSLDTVNSVSSGGHCFFLSGGNANVLDNCYAGGGATTQQGFQLTNVSYSTLNGCKAFSCGGGYQITGGSANQITGCGADTILAANGQDGSGFKINGGTVHTISACLSSVNRAKAFYVTGSAVAASLYGVQEVSPGAGATASVQVDAASTAIAVETATVTATSYASGTTTQITGGVVTVAGNASVGGTLGVTGLSTLTGGATSPGTIAITGTGIFAAQPNAVSTAGYSVNVNGSSAFDQMRIFGSGQIAIGTGSAARDVFFGRAGTNTAYSNPNFLVGAQTALGDNGSGELQLANATTAPTTNPVGGAAIYAVNGTPWYRDPSGFVSNLVSPPSMSVGIPGSKAETVERNLVSTAVAGVSGTLYIQQIFLPAGSLISHIGFATGTTAAGTPTHWWAALLDNTYKQQAHSADQTTGAMAASTWFNLAMAANFTTTYSGIYYLAIVVAATTMPTLLASGITPAAQFITGASVPTPLLGGPSTTGLTTPGTDGTTVYAAPTAAAAPFYLYCS